MYIYLPKQELNEKQLQSATTPKVVTTRDRVLGLQPYEFEDVDDDDEGLNECIRVEPSTRRHAAELWPWKDRRSVKASEHARDRGTPTK